MKRLFIMLVMSLLTVTSTLHAEVVNVTNIATLEHDGQTTVFYDGANSLKNAVEAAVSGDVITLSPGSFNSCELNKGLTINGAGGWGTTGVDVTTLTGDFVINIPEDDPNALHLEGLHMPLTIAANGVLRNAVFKRVNVSVVNLAECSTHNCSFIQSHINNEFFPDSESDNLYLTNCSVEKIFGNSDVATLILVNCNVRYSRDYNPHLNAVNTIFYRITNNSTSSFDHCFWDHDGGNPNSTATQSDCWSEWYNNFLNKFVDRNPLLEFTEEAAKTYIGTDGTVIGKFGGALGWVTRPAIPYIENLEVEKEVRPDGKIGVKFNVKTQD